MKPRSALQSQKWQLIGKS